MSMLKGYGVCDHLHRPGARLRASARFGEGLAAALWERSDRGHYRLDAPNHHTLCFAVLGGESYRRRRGPFVQQSFGAGQTVVLPAGVTSDWEASGQASIFHLYIPTALFERRVVETLDADPRLVSLRDDGFRRDPTLEGIIRSTLLPLSWHEPADRMAMTEAGELLTAYLAARCSERAPRALVVRGGLAPALLRRVRDYIESHLHQEVTLGELASLASLSRFTLPAPSNARPAAAPISTCCGGAPSAPSTCWPTHGHRSPRWLRRAASAAPAILRHASARRRG
jgi:AraC family transcriptional regulator